MLMTNMATKRISLKSILDLLMLRPIWLQKGGLLKSILGFTLMLRLIWLPKRILLKSITRLTNVETSMATKKDIAEIDN